MCIEFEECHDSINNEYIWKQKKDWKSTKQELLVFEFFLNI